MCWTSYNYPLLKIAEEDIPIIKVGLFIAPIQCISPCYRKTYVFNLTYCETLGSIISLHDNPYAVYEGFHSYRQVEGVIAVTKDLALLIYGNDRLIDDWPKQCIAFKGVIPKGAQYYENESHEMVSDRLRITGVL